MFLQLLIASAMVIATVGVHLIGLGLLIRLLRSHHQRVGRFSTAPLTLLFGASLGLFAIHTVEIWLYAALYVALGAVGSFEQALYFSTVTYATIGYGDVVLAHPWRILGAIEGATGIIMLGWSTAFLVSLLAQVKLLSHDWLAGTPLSSGVSNRRADAS
jgi:voltage-gated potassium channel Kch